jgi:molybdate transport system substrate-binding protein
MGVSYRHAWVLVQEINSAAGEPLVVAATGGSHGGGAQLTPHGRLAVAEFRTLQEQLRHAAAGLVPGRRAFPTTACVHVAAAVSLQEVLGQLLMDYALLRPASQVRTVFGASDELADQVLAGASTDLFLTADRAQLERLIALDFVEPGTAAPLAENTLAAIAASDRDLRVGRPTDLLSSSVKRIALAVASCPLGGYSRAYLERQGIYDAVLGRALLVDHSQAVVAAVETGQADVGLVYASATVSAHCRVLFRARRLPAAIQYAGAVIGGARHAEEARRLLEFLRSPPARRRFRRCGFLPVHAQRAGP